jgi:hypothetical protein
MNTKIIFRPICWITEFFWKIRYNENISGHDFVEREDKSLECEICGKISK